MTAPADRRTFPGMQNLVLYRSGETNPHARLTDEQVIEARRRARTSPGCVAALARQWGCSHEGLRTAVRGINWSHLDHIEPPVKQRTMSPRHEYTDDERADLLFFLRTMVDAGASVAEAARNVGLTDPTARLWLRTYR
jgi:hypothetical protein